MKKMIYLMTTVIVTLAFHACSVNDNPATPSTPFRQAVITVNTRAMYEEVGLAELIEFNLPKALSISDTVLIYDQNGHLVKKLGTETKSFEPLTFVVNDLPNGTYTLVGWQSGNFDNGTTIEKMFVLADEAELSTVKLLQLDPITMVGFANGLATATVTINSSSFEATVTPKLVGSILNLMSEKAPQEYGLDQIGLYRMDQATTGIWLDPARSEDDRWIIEPIVDEPYPFAYLDQGETQFMHYTLEHGDDIPLSLVTWKIVGDTYEPDEIVAQGHQKLPNGSNMVYYFDVDRISYQPPFLGPTDQLSAWKADRDAGILVNTPYLKWGSNLAEVEAHKKAKQFWAIGNNQLEFWEGNGWHYWYYVAPSLTEQYIFETEDGQNLLSASCICHDDNLPVDILHKSLLLQGYTYLGKLHYPDTEDYDDLFLSADGKTEVSVYHNGYGGWVMDYYDLYPEDLDHIIPANLAPASSKVRSIAPNLRRSSTLNRTGHHGFMKPSKQTR